MQSVSEELGAYISDSADDDRSNPTHSRKSGSATGQRAREFKLLPRHFATAYVFIEGLMVALVAFLAKVVYVDLYLGDASPIAMPYLGTCILLGVLTVAALHMTGAAHERSILSEKQPQATVFSALLMAFLGLILLLFLLKSTADYSRVWMAVSFTLSLAALGVARVCAPSIAARLRRSGKLSQRVAIYGTPGLTQEVHRHLSDNGLYVDSMIFRVDELDLLVAKGKASEFDSMIIALPSSAERQLQDALTEVSVLPFEIRTYNETSQFSRRIYGIETVGNISLMVVQRRPLTSWQVVAKRMIDIAGGTAGLMLLLPALPIIAYAIKRESRGPVFFIQRRHGFNHKIINVWKFRTMTVTEDGDTVRQAQQNDARVTRVGAFLRKTSIDELPQLVNVIRGDMSLVGPRPHALAHNDQYGRLIRHYARRHRVKPGLTGLAQIHGFRGNTQDTELMRRRVEYDLEYIEHWSVWNDITILFQTVFKVANGSLAEKDNVIDLVRAQEPSAIGTAVAANQNNPALPGAS